MTREQAKREIDFLDYYLQNHTNDYSEESHTAMTMAYKALEQQSTLDKIRAEIIELRSKQNVGVMECLDIIDKYKESEG